MDFKDDITNVRTWEIKKELNESGYSDEDINNLPLETWFVAGLVQKLVRQHIIQSDLTEEQLIKGINRYGRWLEQRHKVTPCHDSFFHDIPWLEDEERFGFFKSEGDVRPSSCSWIKKEDAERLYERLKEQGLNLASNEGI